MDTERSLWALTVSIVIVLVAVGVLSMAGVADTPTEAETEPGPPDNPTDDNETVEVVSGTLEGTSGEDYRLADLALDIGAQWYVEENAAPADLDGDGGIESIREEFDGLVGTSVTLTVESDGTEADVLEVGDNQYRQEGPPPWAGGPNGNGPPAHAGT